MKKYFVFSQKIYIVAIYITRILSQGLARPGLDAYLALPVLFWITKLKK